MNLVETLSKVSCDGGGQLSSCRALKARLQLPESDLCTALVHLVFQVGVLGVVCCRCSMWAWMRSSTSGSQRPASACRILLLIIDLWEGPSVVSPDFCRAS